MKVYGFNFAFALLALIACSKEFDHATVAGDEISFIMGGDFATAVGTRSTTPVTTSNISAIYITATTESSSEEPAFTNALFEKSVSTWTGGKYWPATDPGYHFYAANLPIDHTSSGAIVSPGNADTDIVVAYLANPTFRQQNTLVMDHIFARIGTVGMKAPAGYAVTDMKVSIRPITSGTYNLKNGRWTVRGAEQNATYILGNATAGVTISTETSDETFTGPDNDLWLIPGEYVLTASYTLSKGNYSNDFTKTCTAILLQGKNNHVGPVVDGTTGEVIPNIPTPDDVSEITLGITVTPWEDHHIEAHF